MKRFALTGLVILALSPLDLTAFEAAAAAVVAHGFETLGLERLWALRFRGNAAAARVLEKVGLAHEGSRRRFVPERGREECVEQHGCLRWEYFARVAQCGYAGAPSPQAEGATAYFE